MAIQNRYSITMQGSVIMTGNTMGLALGGASSVRIQNFPVASVAPPGGTTTTNYANNSAYSKLQLPATATVKHAQLIWGGSYNIPTGSVDPNLSIQVTDPNNNAYTVARNPATTQTLTQTGYSYYVQAVDVTTIVKTGGSGFYKVGAVPGILGDAHLGYILIVAYEDTTETFKNINIWSANDFTPPPVIVPVTGFVTPSSGPVNARLILAANGGQPWATGETVKFGPTQATAMTISGPNNPATNFFASQINNNSGLLDTTGTFGTRNVTPGGSPSGGERYNYDITNLDVSSTLTNNLTSASLVFGGGGDVVVLNGIALQIDINSADVNTAKYVDKTTAVPNDVLNYTMVLSNSGLLNANNVVVVDTIPAGTAFVNGSLKVNGVTVAGSPLPPGYTIGTLPFGTAITLNFNVSVTTIPAVETALNNSFYTSYTFTPTTIPFKGSLQSNVVTTTIPAASFINTYKTVNKVFTDIGDYITYTFTIPNTGGKEAGNVIFVDTIPVGTTYVSDSFYLNGTLVPGANPQAGVNLGTIAAGLFSTLSFRVQVYTLPTVNPMPNNGTVYFKSYGVTPMSYTSNTVQTKVNNARVAMIKVSDKNYADIGSIITYTILLNNSGSVSAGNVLFSDTIPNDTTFVNGSFSVNGGTIPGSPTPPGLNLGTIPVGVTTVSFKVTVNTIPSPNPIPNSAATTFNYIVDPSIPSSASGSSNSNIAYTQVNHAQVSSSKIVDRSYVTCGDILKYTVVITNTGNVAATNIVFQDTIPNGTQFINNSFTANGVTIPSANPSAGVNISNIAAGATSTLTFLVVVIC